MRTLTRTLDYLCKGTHLSTECIHIKLPKIIFIVRQLKIKTYIKGKDSIRRKDQKNTERSDELYLESKLGIIYSFHKYGVKLY